MDPVYSLVLPCGADTTAPEKYWKVSNTYHMVEVWNSKRSGRSRPSKGGRLFVRRIRRRRHFDSGRRVLHHKLSRVAKEGCYVSLEVCRLFLGVAQGSYTRKRIRFKWNNNYSFFICSRSNENSIWFIIKNNTILFFFGRCLWAIPARVWPTHAPKGRRPGECWTDAPLVWKM